MAVVPVDPAPADPPTEADVLTGPRRGPGRRDLLLVAGVAVVARLAVALWLARAPAGLSDPAMYRGFARHIADGDGYVSLLGEPTTYYPPGYPLFLGALQKALDIVGLRDSLPAGAAVVQALLGGVGAAAVAVAGGRIGRALVSRKDLHVSARSVGVAAGLAIALWPNLVAHASVLLSETLFVALFACFLAGTFVLADGDRPRWGPAVATAAALGAATLVRPQVLLCVPAVAVAWWVAKVPWRRSLPLLGVLVAGVVVLVVPWTVRNAIVMGSPVPISTNGGDNLCIGFRDDASGGFAITDACDTGDRYVDGAAVEVRRDRENVRRALEWIRENPLELPALSARKLWLTFRDDSDALRAAESYGDAPRLGDGPRTIARAIGDVGWFALVVAALGGAVVLAGRGSRSDPAVLALATTTLAGLAVPVLFFGDPRFKLGMAPCVALLAGVGLATAVAAVRSRRGGPEGHTADGATETSRSGATEGAVA